MGKIISYIIGLIVGLILGVLLATNHYRAESSPSVSDTTTVIDTIPYYYPVPKDSMVTRFVYCKLPVAEPATLPQSDTDTAKIIWSDPDTAQLFCGAGAGGLQRQCDSVNVIVPIEQKVYEDSTYKAWASGYMVSLDSIFVYPRTTTIRIRDEKPPNRWGLGVQIGCGYNGKVQPYIGVGVSYNIIQW